MTVAEQALIDGEQLKYMLEQSVQQCKKKLLFISAYMTQTAIDWLDRYVPEGVEVSLICRLLPMDVFNGSTNISALTTALDKGWKVSCLHSLHAKLYSIDDNNIYVGSANLTSNGLRIYGIGNIEACSSVPANENNLRFISNIETSATELSHNILQRMDKCIQEKEPVIHMDKWPQDILPHEEGIWVRDFFWFNPQSRTPQGNEKIHDLEIISAESLDSATKGISEKILTSRCIQWLISRLKEQPENELYFGNISRLLHDELKDDPAPYRKDVKTLVQNLLAYCEVYLSDTIEVSRPNHSQRVRLLVAS